jgi:hypothetical protein
MRASTVLANGYGWCVPKAVLLAAVCRAAGIPARLGFADVCNHLSTARMRQSMETPVFYWHGYTDIWIDGAWRKATPAFNLSLCEKFGLKPLDFDGRSDSIYHPFDLAGNRHMEYLHQRGSFDDLPLGKHRQAFVQVELDHIHAALHAGLHVGVIEFDAVTAAGALAPQQVQQRAVAAAKVKHPRAFRHEPGDGLLDQGITHRPTSVLRTGVPLAREVAQRLMQGLPRARPSPSADQAGGFFPRRCLQNRSAQRPYNEGRQAGRHHVRAARRFLRSSRRGGCRPAP